MPTKKEKNIFFAGASVALLVSILTNIFVNGLYNLMNKYNTPLWIIWILFILSGLASLYIVIWFSKKIIPIYIES